MVDALRFRGVMMANSLHMTRKRLRLNHLAPLSRRHDKREKTPQLWIRACGNRTERAREDRSDRSLCGL